METEMDRLRRNTKDEEEESERRQSWDSGRSETASPREGGEEEAQHQRGFSLLSGSRISVEDQEEETDIDEIPLSKQEKSVRWTDVCHKDDGRAKEEVKMEERIKHQLFSGVCWHVGHKTSRGNQQPGRKKAFLKERFAPLWTSQT